VTPKKRVDLLKAAEAKLNCQQKELVKLKLNLEIAKKNEPYEKTLLSKTSSDKKKKKALEKIQTNTMQITNNHSDKYGLKEEETPLIKKVAYGILIIGAVVVIVKVVQLILGEIHLNNIPADHINQINQLHDEGNRNRIQMNTAIHIMTPIGILLGKKLEIN
jgi:hypothetical protein